ncbi:MAG: hypothetical protein GC161_04355 [Planctomycetaceae bacterium]|nr:hypothetical protein [Planctomycetaceae bacterium]
MLHLFSEGGWPLAAILLLSAAGWWIACRRLFDVRRDERGLQRGDTRHPPTDSVAGRMLQRLELIAPVLPSREAIQGWCREERGRLKAGLPLVATIAAACPLLGLLGTLLGMIHTFRGLGVDGPVGREVIAEGIAAALTSTQAGLVAALPLVVLHGYVGARAERAVAAIERHTTRWVSLREPAP